MRHAREPAWHPRRSIHGPATGQCGRRETIGATASWRIVAQTNVGGRLRRRATAPLCQMPRSQDIGHGLASSLRHGSRIMGHLSRYPNERLYVICPRRQPANRPLRPLCRHDTMSDSRHRTCAIWTGEKIVSMCMSTIMKGSRGMREIKPVGICPRCLLVPRLPGRAYCAECGKAALRMNRIPSRRRARRTGATPPTRPDKDGPPRNGR